METNFVLVVVVVGRYSQGLGASLPGSRSHPLPGEKPRKQQVPAVRGRPFCTRTPPGRSFAMKGKHFLASRE